MGKVLLIGIDGLDRLLLSRFENNLPHFKKLKESSANIILSSVFPPDSPTAWASIYTGKNPAKHGIVSFRDPFTPAKACEYLGTDISNKTFWDIVGKRGKKVCILFPHLGYPVWPVNGIMVGRTTEVDIRRFDIQTYPKALSEEYDLSGLKPMTSFPINVGGIIEPTKKLIRNEVEFGLKLLKDFEWDLYFIYFSSLDNIEHLFWMYYDKNDPEYREKNPYENVIPDFYKFYDEHVVGRFIRYLDSDTTLIILSDHGHAMRPINVVNINEFLRKAGFLFSKLNSKNSIHISSEVLRKWIVNVVNKHRSAGKIASIFLRVFPNSLYTYVKLLPIDLKSTIACLSDPSGGLKAYSYAGIKIRNHNLQKELYEEIRDQIIRLLLDIKDPITSKTIVEWVVKREELYSGPYLYKYPDVLFKLKNNWGVGWDINKDLFGKSFSHRIHSGNHRQDTPVFLIYDCNKVHTTTSNATLMDIAPTIFSLLGIKGEFAFDGKSIIAE